MSGKRTSEIADRVREELTRSQQAADEILGRAAAEERRYEAEARLEADRLLERRIDRLRELRDAVAERSEQVEAQLGEYASAIRTRANAALWQAAIAGRDDPPERTQ